MELSWTEPAVSADVSDAGKTSLLANLTWASKEEEVKNSQV